MTTDPRRSTRWATITVLILAGGVALGLARARAQEPDAKAPIVPSRSSFALTIYSTADPASFDPKQIARFQMVDPNYSLPG
ncbi:MAG: hypothetical protein AB7I30_10790, partial [Isosphaeraceae bacterium]